MEGLQSFLNSDIFNVALKTLYQNFFLIASFPDHCLLLLFFKYLKTLHFFRVNHVFFYKDDEVYLLLERMAEGKIEVILHEDGRSINPAFEGNFSLYSFPWKGKIRW